jgi:hypothetical protein
MHSLSRVTQHLLALTFSILFVVLGVFWIRSSQQYWVERPREDQGLISASAVKMLSFGQDPVVTDWLWIRFLSDPSIARTTKGIKTAIFRDLDLATELDGKFFEAFFFGASLLSVIRDDSESALTLLLKAQRFRKQSLHLLPENFREEFWSDEYVIPLTLAYLYIYELDDLPNGAAAFQEAATLPKAPAYLQSLIEKLKTTAGQIEVGLKYTAFLSAVFKDNPGALERLERRKRGLITFQYLFEMNKNYLVFLFYLTMWLKKP